MSNIKELPPIGGTIQLSDDGLSALVVSSAPAGEIAAPRPPPDLIAHFLGHYSSARTRQTMTEGLERVATVAGVPFKRMIWHQLTPAHVALIHARLGSHVQPNGEGYSRATVNVTMSALRQLFESAYELGLMSRDAVASASKLGKTKHGQIREAKGRALTAEEVSKLKAYCDAQRGPYGAFLGALFALFLGGGLRCDELCRLPAVGAIVGSAGTAGSVLVTGKGNKQARQALAERELAAVLRWVEVRRVLEPACDRLFVRVGVGGQLTAPDRPLIERTVYEICDETAKRCGIAPFAPHDLRRTFATRLYRAGWSDTAVQKMMRHADVRTTQRYDKREQEEIDALRMAVDMWPGAKPAELFTEKTEQKKEEG